MTAKEHSRTNADQKSSLAGVAIRGIDVGTLENMTREIGNVTVIARETENETETEIVIGVTVIGNSSSVIRADEMGPGQTTDRTMTNAVSIKSQCLTQNRRQWVSLTR